MADEHSLSDAMRADAGQPAATTANHIHDGEHLILVLTSLLEGIQLHRVESAITGRTPSLNDLELWDLHQWALDFLAPMGGDD